MGQPELLPAKFFVFSFLVMLLFSCGKISTNKLQVYNADSVSLQFVNGICYRNEAFFTGRIYGLQKNGDTSFIKEYVDGLENGLSKQFYGNGKPAEIRFYANGKKTGKHVGFWENGYKKFEFNFADDLFEGEQNEWHENGKHYRRLHYMAGHENGLQQMWDSTGLILANYEAKNGRNYGNIGKKNCRSIWQGDSVFAIK